MRILNHAFTALLCLFLLAPLHAGAAKINDEGAKHLKTHFTKMLEDQKKLISVGNASALNLQGDLTVETTENYYAVTFPHISLQNADGSKIIFGIMSMNMTPHETKGLWKTTFAIPTPFRAFDKTGKETTKIAIKGQQAGGIYNEDLQQFLKLDAQYNDITIDITPENKVPQTASLGSVNFRFDFNEDSNKRYSGPAYIEFNDLAYNLVSKNSSVKINQIKGSITTDQYDPQVALTHRNKMIALYDSGELQKKPLSAETQRTLAASTFDTLTKSMNGFTGAYTLSGIDLFNEKNNERLSLNEAKLAMSTDGFLTDKAAIGVSAQYGSLTASTMTQASKDITPADLNLDIKIKNIPFKQLLTIGQNTMAGASDNPQAAFKMLPITLMMKLPAILSQAGTAIELNDNYARNTVYDLALNGEIRADLTAANSATAKVTALFKGMSALIKVLQNAIDDPETKNPTKFKQSLDMLTMLQKISGDPTTRPEHKFEFIMNPQGQMLLNDQDIKTLKP